MSEEAAAEHAALVFFQKLATPDEYLRLVRIVRNLLPKHGSNVVRRNVPRLISESRTADFLLRRVDSSDDAIISKDLDGLIH